MKKKINKYIVLTIMYMLFTVMIYTLLQTVNTHYVVSAIAVIGGTFMIVDTSVHIYKMRNLEDEDKDIVIYYFHYFIIYMVASALCVSLLFSAHIILYSVIHGAVLTYMLIKYGDKISDVAKNFKK